MPFDALDPIIYLACAYIEIPISLKRALRCLKSAPFGVVGAMGLSGFEVVFVTIVRTVENDRQEL